MQGSIPYAVTLGAAFESTYDTLMRWRHRVDDRVHPGLCRAPARCRPCAGVPARIRRQHDAFLTGQATNYDYPANLKDDLIERVGRLAVAGQAPASYAESLAAADAHTLWLLGRDIVRLSAGDGLGREFVHAPCPTLHLWSQATTTRPAGNFLSANRSHIVSWASATLWPWVVDPGAVADSISDFMLRSRQTRRSRINRTPSRRCCR